jgi:hypothetical protein
MKNLINLLLNWLNINPQKKDEDMPFAFAQIGNMLLGLMLDKAQTAGKKEIMKMVDEHLDDDVKKMLDGGISDDASHAFGSLTEMLNKKK